MLTLRVEGIVIGLDRIPVIVVRRAASDSTTEWSCPAVDENLCGITPRKGRASDSEIISGGIRVDGFQALVVIDRLVIAANAD